MALLGTRVARVGTDLLKGFESLSYGKHYITFVNLHKSRGGMGGVFQWKCWASALMALPGVLHGGYNWGVHTFIKNYPDIWTNKTGMMVGETEHKQPGVPTGCLSRVCVHLSISPQSLSCLPSPPGLLTVLAAFSPIPAVRAAFLTHQPQLSGATCWVCTLPSSSCTWRKAVPGRP